MEYSIADEVAAPGLREFVKEFHEDRTREISQLIDCVNSSRFEVIRAMAHKWKGFSAPYGFSRLGILSEKLEKASKDKQYEKTKQLISEIETYLLDKREYIN